jgi:ABC-type multidrug transport system ATPase subunit
MESKKETATTNLDSETAALELPTDSGASPPLILSKEFRWLFVVSFIVLLGLAAAFLYVGIQYLLKAQYGQGFLYVGGGALAGLLGFGVRQTRQYFLRLYKRTVLEIKRVELSNLKEDDFERVDEILELRGEKAKVDFQRNAEDAFLLESFHLKGVNFFAESHWQFKPGVNILLGRNGFGKSLIMRSLASLLQRNKTISGELFNDAAADSFAELLIQRNGATEVIHRNGRRFTESPGKIPILAVPDSRFVNRGDTIITAKTDENSDEPLDLRADGALHFLEHRPYGQMIAVLFNELCFDYFEYGSFKHPVFQLLEQAIYQLTGDRFVFESVERVARNKFRLFVLTEGNDRPLPIQYASQGTLSVLGVIGVLRSYLKAFFPKARDESFLNKPAIVFVDELDAHLHPQWQQKLIGILRTTFPNVQFVLSAHSPLVVAGSWVGEVAVMTKTPGGLVIKQLERDFLGTPVEEIYKVIFGIEDIDDSYLKSASRATSGFSHRERIDELEKKTELSELERRELSRLIREQGMIARAAEVKVERKDDQERIGELEAQLEALQDKLGARRSAA